MCGGHPLVDNANHRCCAILEIVGSSDCSEAATEPHGYSAPMPMPTTNLGEVMYETSGHTCAAGGEPTDRIALNMDSMPPTL